jgi:hypothetical protein
MRGDEVVTTNASFDPAAYPFTVRLVRRAGAASPIDELERLVLASGRSCPQAALRFALADDENGGVKPVEPTADWLAREVEHHPFGLWLVTGEIEPCVSLRYHRERILGPYDIVTLNVPRVSGFEPAVLKTTRALLDYVRDLAVAFGAAVTGVYTSDLFTLVHYASYAALVEEPDREDARPEVVRILPTSLVRRLSLPVHVIEYDMSAVPEAVGWINVWSRPVVERIGRDRVEAQAWAIREPAGDGGLLLVATPRAPDRGDIAALEQIAAVSEGLLLDEHQRSTPRAGA